MFPLGQLSQFFIFVNSQPFSGTLKNLPIPSLHFPLTCITSQTINPFIVLCGGTHDSFGDFFSTVLQCALEFLVFEFVEEKILSLFSLDLAVV